MATPVWTCFWHFFHVDAAGAEHGGSTDVCRFCRLPLWRGISVLMETIEFKSSATNLEQPLWIPQLPDGLVLLATISAIGAIHGPVPAVHRPA